MANTVQARKRARQNIARGQRNASARAMYRTSIKKVRQAIDGGKKEEANKAFQEAVPVIDTMVSKGIVHKNKAARKKSRLSLALNKLKIT